MEIRNLEFTFENEGNHLTGLIQTNKLSHVLGSTKKWREVISPNVFARAISNAFKNGRDVDFISDHDDSKILASTKNDSLKLKEDEEGLHVSADIVETSWAKDTLELVKSGIISGLSFGMTVNSQRWSKCDDGVDLRIIEDIDLFEISAVRNPAYPLTNLESRGINVEDVEIPEEEGGEKEMTETENMLKQILELLTKEKQQDKVEDVVEEVVENREDEIVDEKQPKEPKQEKVEIAKIVKEAVVEAIKEVLPPKKEEKPVEKTAEKEEETTKESEKSEEERENEANEIQKDLKHNTDKDEDKIKEKTIVGTNDSQGEKEKEDRSFTDLKEFFSNVE